MAKKINSIRIVGIIIMIISSIFLLSNFGSTQLLASAPIPEATGCAFEFRTNVNTSGQYTRNTWIALDSDSDGVLEGWGYSSRLNPRNDCIVRGTVLLPIKTPEGYDIYIDSHRRPSICIPEGSKMRLIGYHVTSRKADISCLVRQPLPAGTECLPGELRCVGTIPKLCRNGNFVEDGRMVGFCGVNCIIDDDCTSVGLNSCVDYLCGLNITKLIGTQAGSLIERSTRIIELESQIDSLVDELAQVNEEIESGERVIGEKEGIIMELSNKIGSLGATIEEKSKIISGLELSINEKAILIDNLRLTIEEKSKIISGLELSVNEKAILIDNLRLTIEEKSKIISGLELSLSDKEKLVAELTLTIEEREKIINNLESKQKSRNMIIGVIGLILGGSLFFISKKKESL